MSENQVAEICKLVPVVSEQDRERLEAIAAERDASAKTLERVIQVVKPAIRAISSRIKCRDDSTSGRNGCNHVEEIEYHTQMGFKLAGGVSQDKDETGNRGSYGGIALYLLTTGELAHVEFDGTWSNWQGEWDRLSSTLEIIDATEAMNRYDIDDCLQELVKALKEQVSGKATAASKAARERATKLSALAALI